LINNNSPCLVSIIVPAYNVEKYIEKCIKSISNQNYQNIEIIVINDGSNDRTKEILANLSLSESRLHIIDQNNSGVSSSRNVGIKKALGEYLIFVDGDDYISCDFFDYMLSLVKNTSANFGFSSVCFSNRNEKQTANETIKTLSSEEATAKLLSPDIFVGCWNKIYKRSFLLENNIFFSPDLFYGEGLSFIATVAFLSDISVEGNRKVYYYRRNNMSSATSVFDIKKIYNGEKSLLRIKEKVGNNNPLINTMYELHMCNYYLGAISKILTSKNKNSYQADYNKWLTYVRKHHIKLLFSKHVSLYRKALLFFGSLFPSVIAKLDVIRKNKISKSSVEDFEL